MKNLILLAVFLFLGVTVVHAQVKFGPKVGLNIAGANGDDADGTDSRTGISVGGVVNLPVGEIVSVQPEVAYSMRGWKDGDFTIKVDYIDLPVLADVEIVENLSLQGGLLLGFNISATVEDNNGNEADIDDVSTLNAGAAIGAQYEFPFGLFLNARFDTAFNDVIDNNFDAKNNNLSFGAGFFID